MFRDAVYAARPEPGPFKKLVYTNHLNILVALFPATVGIWVLIVAMLSLWGRWGLWGKAAAIAYVLVTAILYAQVFRAKMGISKHVMTDLGPKPDAEG